MTSTAAASPQNINSNVIVRAFEAVGADDSEAVKRAKNFSSTRGWTAWQASQAAAAGAAALAVPAAHIPAMVADIAYIMHKMSYCCWGIGSILGAQVDGKDDFGIILGLWSGDLTETELPMAILTGTAAGTLAVAASTGTAAQIAGKVTGKGVGKGVGIAATAAAHKLGAKAAAKPIGKALGNLAGSASSKFVEKASTKVAAKVGAKLAGKGVAGFIPFVGAGYWRQHQRLLYQRHRRLGEHLLSAQERAARLGRRVIGNSDRCEHRRRSVPCSVGPHGVSDKTQGICRAGPRRS